MDEDDYDEDRKAIKCPAKYAPGGKHWYADHFNYLHLSDYNIRNARPILSWQDPNGARCDLTFFCSGDRYLIEENDLGETTVVLEVLKPNMNNAANWKKLNDAPLDFNVKDMQIAKVGKPDYGGGRPILDFADIPPGWSQPEKWTDPLHGMPGLTGNERYDWKYDMIAETVLTTVLPNARGPVHLVQTSSRCHSESPHIDIYYFWFERENYAKRIVAAGGLEEILRVLGDGEKELEFDLEWEASVGLVIPGGPPEELLVWRYEPPDEDDW